MQDLRLALRALRVTPVVTVVAVLSIALGIGANTTVFSLVNSLLLRALPVAEPHRLVIVSSRTANSRGGQGQWSYAVWDQIRQRTELFDGAAAYSTTRFDLAPRGAAQFVNGLWVNSAFFKTLGVRIEQGRTFSDADDRRGGGPDGAVAIVSHSFSQRHFGDAASTIGRTLTLDTVPFTIIGVTPPEFYGLEVGSTFDVIVPFGNEPLIHGPETWFDARGEYWFTILGRLKPGQSLDAAAATLQRVERQIWEMTVPRNARPESRARYLAESFSLLPATAGRSTLRRQYGRQLVTLLVVVALVLLVACANIANVALARGEARRHELTVRMALGASRWALVRQLLAETLILVALAAVLGWLISSWASTMLLRQLSTPQHPVFLDLSIDWHVSLFTIGVAVATIVVFGVLPAMRTSRAAPIEALREHGKGLIAGGRIGIASSLLVAQVAVSVVLVVAAAMFARTFASLATRPLGFEPDRVLLVGVDAQRAGVPPTQNVSLYEQLRDAVRAVPGVSGAAVSMVTPVSGFGLGPRIDVSGGAQVPGNVYGVNGVTNVISPGWFDTLGMSMIEGRDFNDGDRQRTPLVAIVNQTLGRQFLAGASPLGHTITLTTPNQAVTMDIVGVVADSVYFSLREVLPATVFTPWAQFYMSPSLLSSATLSIRAKDGAPAFLTRSVADAMNGVNPRLTLTFRPLSDQIDASLVQERLVAMLSGFFSGLALLLAALGLYGVISYAVTRRRTEIGIRMALGAAPGAVVRLVVSRVSILVGCGLAIGGGLSLWASRFVAALLYGVEPRDPLTVLGAMATLTSVGCLAGWLPAWRAARIDPAEVLREG
jgi:putative ABC transport system permease protein